MSENKHYRTQRAMLCRFIAEGYSLADAIREAERAILLNRDEAFGRFSSVKPVKDLR